MSMKKLAYILLAFGLLALASCVQEEQVTAEFTEPSYSMAEGDTLKMAGLLTVKNSTEQPVFTSSNEDVAKFISRGVLVAVASGETTVKAVVEGVEADCQVVVSSVKAENIIIKAPSSILPGEDWKSVTVKVQPDNYNYGNIVWEFTPSSAALGFASEKVSSSEYKIKCGSFVKDGNISIKVTDKLSGKEQTAVVKVGNNGVPASRILLAYPQRLTYGEDVSIVISASVEAAGEYDLDNLEWEFTPSSPDLKFKQEKVSATEYKFSFLSYVADAYVLVSVQDALSEVFSDARIRVLDRPKSAPSTFVLEASQLSLFLGDEPFSLKLNCDPADYADHLLQWTSSDESVVTVDNGLVTVVGEGKAVIKVREIIFGTESTCEVTVRKPAEGVTIKQIVLSETSIQLRVGEEAIQLTATCFDANGNLVENYANLFWEAAPMEKTDAFGSVEVIEVVEVFQQGLVKAKNAGSTHITVSDKANSAVKAICNVSVQAAYVKVSEVQLVPSEAVLPVGESLELTTRVLPENADDKAVTYESSDESVAVVDAYGVVTAKAVGEAVIKAVATNGVWGECRVKVANGLYFHDARVMLLKGNEAQLSVENLTEETVAWSSSNTSVVTVSDNGVVKGIAAGEAKITATAGAFSATCVVEVVDKTVDFTMAVNVDAHVAANGLMQGKTVKLNPEYYRKDNDQPYYPANKEWKSSDETIATVDAYGNVTAVAEEIEKSGVADGKKVVITHVADGQERSVEIVVVKAMPEQIVMTAVPQVDGVPYKMIHGETFTFKAKVLPAKASQGVWFSGGGYAALNDNTYTANTIGVQYFTAYASDDTSVRYHFSVEVIPVPVQSAVINYENLDICIGDQAYLDVTITPSNASYQEITWSSSDKDVVSVDSKGMIEGKAVGTAVVTGKLNDGITEVSCTVNVTERQATVSVGDYYYSNGKTSSSKDETGWGEIIGVVFSVQNPSLNDSGLEGKYTHGLVVSLEEVAGIQWQENPSNVGQWLADNKGYTNLTNKTHLCGYTNTQMLKLYSEYNPDNKVLPLDYAPEVALPSSASGWYLPSYAELEVLKNANNAGLSNGVVYKGDISARIEAAGGTPFACEKYHYNNPDGSLDAPSYWSTTENESVDSWVLVMHLLHGGQENRTKLKTYYITRYIFAF